MTPIPFIRMGVFFYLKPMWVYLKLQFLILNRKTKDFGVPPILAYPLLLILLILLSNTLYAKTNYAGYFILTAALSLVSRLSEPKRNVFLKSLFNSNAYTYLRIVENIICCLPFTLFLTYKNQYLFVLALNVLALLIALLNFTRTLNFTIPTPFGKKPFEFVIGFRNTFFVFPIAYFLTYTSIRVDNFNLGIFSLLLTAITCFTYYNKPENIFFVRNYNLTPAAFLFEKTKTSFIYFTLLSLPIVVALSVSFFSKIDLILIFYLFCYVYLAAIVFAKYSAFPNTIEIQQVMLITISLLFPFSILLISPFFYVQSIKKLTPILND